MADRGGLKVAAARCSTCIFGPNSPIKDRPARMRELKRFWRLHDSHQVCHKFAIEGYEDGDEPLDEDAPPASINGEEVVCRGFYDTQTWGQMLRIADRLGCIVFVPQPAADLASTPAPGERS